MCNVKSRIVEFAAAQFSDIVIYVFYLVHALTPVPDLFAPSLDLRVSFGIKPGLGFPFGTEYNQL
jgi:hypothetical protein